MKINVKTIKNIYKKDLGKIATNWVTIVIIVGLSVLPSLYAWINIYASWDPYSNTKGIKVAVVNNDVGGTIQGISFNIGKEVTDMLKNNTKLGWTFYNDADEGIKKAEDGEVYATIIIPSDFSLEMSTVLDKNPVKPSLEYYVNQKINAIAPKMTDSGASTIQREISASFIETVTKKLFEILNKAGINLKDNYPQIEKYKNLLYVLNDNYPKINSSLDDLIAKSGDAFVKIDKTAESVALMQDTLNKTIEFNSNFSKNLSDINGKIDEVSPDINENLQLMQSTFSKVSSVADNLSQKVSIYKPEVLADIDSAIDETNRLSKNMKQLSQDLTDLGENVPQDMKDQTALIINNLITCQNLLNNLRNSAGTIDQTLKVLNSLNTLNSSISSEIQGLVDNVNNLLNILSFLPKKDLLLDMRSRLIKIQDDFNDVSDLVKKLTATLQYTETDMINTINTLIYQINSIETLIQQSSDKLSQSISENSYKVASDLKATSADLDKLSSQLTTVKNNLSKNKDIETLLPDISKLTFNVSNDLSKLQISLNKDIIPMLQSSLQNGSMFAANLNTVLNSVNNDLGFLKDALSYISSHGQIAVADLKTLRSHTGDLGQKINDITLKVKALSGEVNIQDIINLLQTNGNTEGDFLSLPVNLQTHVLFPVENYGAALTPFYTTLSLWVGALLLSALLSVKCKYNEFSFNAREEHISKYLLFISVAIIQALIVSLGDIFVLRIKIMFPALFVLLTVYSSIIFTTIVYTLVSLFSNVGKAIGIVFLVLQLAGAGGTFPIQVTPDFFQKIHSILPFTYSISAMREALAGVTYSTLSNDVLLLSVFFFIFLILGLVLKPRTTKLFSKFSHQLNDSGIIGH